MPVAKTLPCGTRVLWLAAPETDLAFVSLCLSAGFDAERRPARAQIAHYTEHLLAHHDAASLARLRDEAVECNAWTSCAATAYHAEGPAGALASLYLPLLASSFRAAWSPHLLQAEATAVITESQIRCAIPSDAHRRFVASHEQPDSAEAVDCRTETRFVERMRDSPELARASVDAFVRAHYTPARAHLTVVCAARHRGALVRGALRVLPAGGPAAPVLPAATPSARRAGHAYGGVHAHRVGGSARTILTVLVATDLGPDDDLVAHFVTSRLQTQLFTELRLRRGLVYGVQVEHEVLAHAAAEHAACRTSARIGVQCRGGNAAAVVAGVARVLRGCAADAGDVRRWAHAESVRVRRAQLCRTPARIAARYEHESVAGYALRTPEQTVAALGALDAAAAAGAYRALGLALRAGRYAIYASTADAEPRALERQLAAALRPRTAS
jgi:predicted Zn-dependent peptidase